MQMAEEEGDSAGRDWYSGPLQPVPMQMAEEDGEAAVVVAGYVGSVKVTVVGWGPQTMQTVTVVVKPGGGPPGVCSAGQ